MRSETFETLMMVFIAIIVFCTGITLGAVVREKVLENRGRIVDEQPAYSIYDLNLDGKVNSLDGDICYDIFLGERIATPDMLDRADVTGDGLVDDKDVVAIMDAVLGKVEE